MGHSKALNRSCKVSKRFLSAEYRNIRCNKTSALAYSYPNFNLQETRQKSRWLSWWWRRARGGRKCLKMFVSNMRKSWPFYKLYQCVNDVCLLPNRDDIIKDELHTTAINFNTSLIVQLYGKPPPGPVKGQQKPVKILKIPWNVDDIIEFPTKAHNRPQETFPNV